MASERLTILLGAGAAIDIGGPSTTKITDALRKFSILDFINLSRLHRIRYIDKLYTELQSYFSSSAINFEDIFNLLEDLISYEKGKGHPPRYGSTPGINHFLEIRNTGYCKRMRNYSALQLTIQRIVKMVWLYESRFRQNPAQHQWYLDFWQKLGREYDLDIYSLNYDSTPSVALGQAEDGFSRTVSGQPFSDFDPNLLLQAVGHKFMNLHGSIYYGTIPTGYYNQNTLTSVPDDLVKYRQVQSALASIINNSPLQNQAAGTITRSPIITGLKKNDKVMYYPFKFYMESLAGSIRSNSKLLIIGYSFSDYHINNELIRFHKYHTVHGRCNIITYLPPSQWHPNIEGRAWPNWEGEKVLARLFGHLSPFGHQYAWRPAIKSASGNGILYNRGFRSYAKSYLRLP